MSSYITKNFSLHELLRSQVAVRKGITNTPTEAVVQSLKALCTNLLQPLREQINKPLFVSSGYRSPELNKAIGGAKNSQHMQGQAVDIECFSLSTKALFEAVKTSGMPFDQLILEYHNANEPSSGWVHLSHRKNNNRNQTFTIG